VDLHSSDLEIIRSALGANSAVLFLGAGFSIDAINELKTPMPSGRQFAEQLWPLLNIPTPFDNSPLTKVYEVALKTKHEPLRKLLTDTFTCTSYASWYELVPSFFWHRIYTTNIDDLVEKLYKAAKDSPRLKVINGLFEDNQERNLFLTELQYIKLNGNKLDSPDEITFSYLQFSRRVSENTLWYDQFIRDYSTKTTIFVGTELDEPLMWNALEIRGKKVKGAEGRPRSFLVRPNFSALDEINLKTLNIVPVKATGQEFFEYLINSLKPLPTRQEVLSKTVGFLPAFADDISPSIKKSLELFYTGFHPVTIPEHPSGTRKSFLLGAAPDWPSIYNNLDARRDCGVEYFKQVAGFLKTDGAVTIALTGYAGSGKSTVLKRLAMEIVAAGTPVFFCENEDTPPFHHFENALATLPYKSVIIIDNISSLGSRLFDFCIACSASAKKHLLIFSERSNKSLGLIRRIRDASASFIEWRIPQLSLGDIDKVIEKLDQNNLLGELRGLAHPGRVHAFEIRANKQLLVAMKEATSGRDFDEIIASELNSISVREAQYLYLCTCIATDVEFALTKQQYVACSDSTPAEALAFLKEELNELIISETGYQDRLKARHRVIANTIVEKLAIREMLKTAYIRLLQTLSHDMSFPPVRSSRIFKLYQKVINHDSICERFQNNILHAREIYDSIASFYNRDHHFWLQYGSLELEYGELNYAENYISQAESLEPNDDFVQTTKANLFYKQAIAENRYAAADQLRADASEILNAQMTARPDDPYPAHIFCSQELVWINRWLGSQRDLKIKALSALKTRTDEIAGRFYYSNDLQKQKMLIAEAYLSMAIR
jgi:hypothetical protein